MARPKKRTSAQAGGFGGDSAEYGTAGAAVGGAGAAKAACDALIGKLRPAQRAAYDYIHSKQGRHCVVTFHRRGGKSHLAATLLLTTAYSNENITIIYAAPKIKSVRTILMPILRRILKDVPEELHPRFDKMDNTLSFPNGSLVLFIGADLGQADSPRGSSCNLFIFDEEGFAEDPEYLVKDVVMPMILESNGSMLHISTPPKSASHYFAALMSRAREDGFLFEMPCTANPDVTPELREEFAKESGGEDSTTYRREYLCEVVTEESVAVFPELIVRKERPRTELADDKVGAFGAVTCAASIDITGLTVLLWGAYNGRLDQFHAIEEKSFLNGSIADVIEAYRASELSREYRPTIILSGAPEMARMLSEYGTPCATKSDFDVTAGIGLARHLAASGKLRIHPSCLVTLRHVYDGIWEDDKRKFARSGDGGRFDGLNALALFLSSTQRSHGSSVIGNGASSRVFRRIGDTYVRAK